jgi:RNA polymerase subunit RPABC4/transcription elongation factor Spt4
LDTEALIARGLQILLALGGAYLIATWFVLAIWTFRDIESRSRSVVTQVFSTLLVVLFWVPGMMLYWLLRPKETLDEAYQRSLEEEYLLQDLQEMPLCPTCHHFVEDEWQICPHCSTQLREPCQTCNHPIDLRWDVCPYCGTEHHAHIHEKRDVAAVPEEHWVDPSVIEKRLREAEVKRDREETKALPAITAASAEDRQELIGSLRRLEVVRRESTNGDTNGRGQSSHQAAPVVTEHHAAQTEEAVVLGPNLDEIAESRSAPASDPNSIPERFKVK